MHTMAGNSWPVRHETWPSIGERNEILCKRTGSMCLWHSANSNLRLGILDLDKICPKKVAGTLRRAVRL